MVELEATFGVLLVLAAFAEKLVCDRPNEEYRCGSACQTTCRNRGEVCPIINIRCNDDCYCIDGYARNLRGRCIPISLCPPKFRIGRRRNPFSTLPPFLQSTEPRNLIVP
ncbi:Inducible metalloproteinase inhibitor protein [Habropoda laboriosa]|uniref:Inducible metalloproteinase inhibitor protein n=1 Tax=Habropoda laboriosa TaxID=597456 RepID=A0A0L7RHF2_9HYME|nr:Inducible metalloproteinase inhibitor protein [Habropoda laboriosa]KOC70249.1 Inducible metalloproteinase inhibitor protein [Habropoda laboriosa]